MAVYLLHFEPSYQHAKHYLGWTEDLGPRVNAHMHGQGARLTQVVYKAGIKMVLARVWEDGDRALERRLKNRHGSGPLCPICCGEAVQMPLLAFMPAYVPAGDISPEGEEQ